jgi:hypothetical protein
MAQALCSSFLLAISQNFLWADIGYLEERLLDLEAQVTSLKSELDSVKSLAEQERPNAFNPSISVIGDIIGQYGHNLKKAHDHDHDHGHKHKGHKHHLNDFHNGVMVREIEFEFRGAIDPWADALIALSIGQHAPAEEPHIHVEEAYARLKQWPGLDYAPLGIELKVGLFKTAFGRMNRIHLHNIPQITYPMALRAFMGNEGYAAPGISLSSSFALGSKSALTLFLEGVLGSKAEIQDKGAEEIPNLVAHAWWHQELAPEHYLDLGLSNLLGRRGKKDSGLLCMLGGDIHYSYLPAGYGLDPVFLFGSELFAANKNSSGPWALGSFTWLQTKFIGSSFIGARWDLAPQDHEVKKFQHALGAYIGFYTTEFLRFRFGYEHVMPELHSFVGDHRYILSMNFVLGSHPVEPYFVNR